MKFEYEPKKYKFDVIYMNIYMLVLIAVCLVLFVKGYQRFWVGLAIIVSAYSVMNGLVLKKIPNFIEYNEEKLYIFSLGKLDKYSIRDITTVNIKNHGIDGTLLVRLSTGTKEKKYWIYTRKFNDSDLLNGFLFDLKETIGRK